MRHHVPRYCNKYNVKYPDVMKSGFGETFAYCTVCCLDFGIGHSEIRCIAKNVKAPMAKAVDSGSSTHKISTVF